MIVAVSMVRDEADIIGWTLGHMLTQVDHAIIADNLSVDATRQILESYGDRVTIVDDTERGYYQSVKMTRLAHQAGEMGAEWVVPFDADEAWTLPDLDNVGADVVLARPYVYVPQPTDDPAQVNPMLRIQHRQPDPESQPKVMFRYHPDANIHMGQHDVDHPGSRADGATVRHYQYRSLEQVRRKVSNGVGAYDASSLSTVYGSHWRQIDALDEAGLAEWWADYQAQRVVFDP